MPDLARELRSLGGGGRRGDVVAALRYLPVAACGAAVPGSLVGSGPARALLVAGLAGLGAQTYTDQLLRRGAPLPPALQARR